MAARRLWLVLLLGLSAACVMRTRGGALDSRSPDAARSIRAHMEFLASDALNGRGSGTRDEWIAVTYVASQLSRLGLEPLGDDGGYVQRIDIERGEIAAPPVLSIGGRRFTHGKEFTVGSMNAATASGTFERHVERSRARQGSVILIPRMTPELQPDLARAELILTRTGGCGPARGGQAGLPRLMPRIVNVQATTVRPTCIALADAAYALAEAAVPGTPVRLDAEVKNVQKTNTWNAVARLRGSDPRAADDVILLSAHIDHIGTGRGRSSGGDTIYNGADDDASGSVAVLELAEAFARAARPRRTLVFAWFGSEESGGAGSRYFADKPTIPLDRIVANLQFEMIGRPDAKVPRQTLWLTGYERSDLGTTLARRGAKLVGDPHPEQNFFTRSDNIQFARRGVVAHTVSSFGLHKDYHQPSDEIGTIDFAHMANAIRSLFAPIRWLADSDFKPAWLPGKQP